ncbi:hypothetical protein, partial [Faecalibaculum rodentium]|uniref:hypothetical protein n=1 Tax=Faecalibaculum rodentium TaxID=1702221 RepID=UPI0026201553
MDVCRVQVSIFFWRKKQTRLLYAGAATIAAPVYSYTLTIMPPFSSTIGIGPDIPLLFMSLVFSLPGLIEWKKEHENRKEPLMSTHNKP